MIIDGKRALAYITTLDEIKPIDGYDKVEYGRTAGWWCVISKDDNMQVGDKIVYFEVDSLVPSTDERFSFLEKKHYKIKTQKMCKVLSQGLIMPVSAFPELQDKQVDTDVTEILGVSYAVKEDNKRKSDPRNNIVDSVLKKHKKLFSMPIIKNIMRHKTGRKILLYLFCKNHKKKYDFPVFVSKTDEERVENIPWVLESDERWIATEKLDGTSCTYAMERRGRKKFEFYVCSRNVRQKDETQECYHDTNVYWDLAFKYDIEKHLKDYLNLYKDEKWVCIQGEGVGKSIQGNPLKLEENDLYVFNLITSKWGRVSSLQGKDTVNGWGMKWVPILGIVELPDNMEEMKLSADGNSAVTHDVLREGIVYRSTDGKKSFKNVSNQYLLKHNG